MAVNEESKHSRLQLGARMFVDFQNLTTWLQNIFFSQVLLTTNTFCVEFFTISNICFNLMVYPGTTLASSIHHVYWNATDNNPDAVAGIKAKAATVPVTVLPCTLTLKRAQPALCDVLSKTETAHCIKFQEHIMVYYRHSIVNTNCLGYDMMCFPGTCLFGQRILLEDELKLVGNFRQLTESFLSITVLTISAKITTTEKVLFTISMKV